MENPKKISVGIMGVGGYTGQELLRLLLHHPSVRICCLSARAEKPKPVGELFPAFAKRIDLVCEDHPPEVMAKGCDVVFLALPHTISMQRVAPILKAGKKVVDLSADFRLKEAGEYEAAYQTKHLHPEFLKDSVYGLPEFYREKIRNSTLVANPGCYPTAVLLAAAPLVKGGRGARFLIADAKSGVTGAGRKISGDLQFAEVNESFKAYKVGVHQHVPEMEEILKDLAGESVLLVFTPHLVPINRGLLATLYVNLSENLSASALIAKYRTFYEKEPFIRILPEGVFPEIKQVLYTNFCDIGIQVDAKRKTAIIVSALDNLVKGAAGQAIQNFNLLSGLGETEGLL